jgi:ribosomal protein L37E
MSNTTDEPRCRKCAEVVQKEDISKCPYCGFTPAAHKKWRTINGILFFVTLFSLIGIPLAVIFFRKARGHYKELEKGVTG